MSFPVFRARSAITLPRARSVERGDVATLTRVTSVPNLNGIHVGERYRPSTLFKYRRDYDLLDDYYQDRMSRYKWYTDWLNPTYWRRYRDPNYDRPLWNNWQPWHLDRYNVKRAIRMYKEGLVDFGTLDRFWIVPSALSRKGKDWTNVYLPAGRYGARRYFYAFA
ncbi:unnamed protein product [Wuchereria bancrofti]|uniref:Uncharacterized protein n=1 Tax=Wuchereria bancrofti TaxID=6293 RepID=A0A3P7FM96_WUCBA|nr:unnamed protein product [Wuchereria bancrofti]